MSSYILANHLLQESTGNHYKILISRVSSYKLSLMEDSVRIQIGP
ncbi:hypothetical protein [Leptospira tipperaryensis]|nr:hypothetical protein [Leptospira tipperaryensis]